MTRIYCLLVVFCLIAPINAADLGSFEEVTAGNFFGFGARQMSMGGAGIASSIDGAALYYNPAALTRIHTIEFQVGLTHQKFTSTTTQSPNRYIGYTSTLNGGPEIDQTKTRFGTINLAIPVPTYRGSLVVAFGINRALSFDRTALFHVIDDSLGSRVEDLAREFETGTVYMYSGAAGIEISPNVALGLGLNVYSGVDEFIFNADYHFDAADFSYVLSRKITEDYIGATIKGGILVRPNNRFSFGLAVETPLDWQVKWKYYEDYVGSDDNYSDRFDVEYDLTRPFIIGTGLSYRFGKLLFAGDFEYIDWSQLSYGDNPDMELENDSLTQLYRSVMNIRVGAEYQLPRYGLAFRAGAFSNPLPYDDRFFKTDRKGFTLGFGWLIDDVLLVETAFVKGGFERNFDAINGFAATAEDDFQRLYATVSYRY